MLSWCTVAFGLRHNLDAFIFYRGPGGAAEEFHDISYWVNIMKTVDYVAQTTIGDAVLVSTRTQTFVDVLLNVSDAELPLLGHLQQLMADDCGPYPLVDGYAWYVFPSFTHWPLLM